jgi:hypothetical protein
MPISRKISDKGFIKQNTSQDVSGSSGSINQFGNPIYVDPLLDSNNGGWWFLDNSTYDPINLRFLQTDSTKASQAVNMRSQVGIPFEGGTPGMAFWICVAGHPIISNTYGSVSGWQNQLILINQNGVLGGFGLEIDGYGTLTNGYGRFVNNSLSGTQFIGMLSNAFSDYSGFDDNTKPSWRAGIKGDSFVIERAAANTNTFVDFMTISSAGVVSFPAITPPNVIPLSGASSGTYIPTAGTKYIIVEMVGAGGGGNASSVSSLGAGAGGGAGAYQKFMVTNPGSYTFAGSWGGIIGGAGGSATFGANVAGGGGFGASPASSGAVGGAGGTNTNTSLGTNLLNIAGAAGQGGGGGNIEATGGQGGSSPFGGAGAGGSGRTDGLTGHAGGTASAFCGSGGGGGGASLNNSNGLGGAGGDSNILVIEYFQ